MGLILFVCSQADYVRAATSCNQNPHGTYREIPPRLSKFTSPGAQDPDAPRWRYEVFLFKRPVQGYLGIHQAWGEASTSGDDNGE